MLGGRERGTGPLSKSRGRDRPVVAGARATSYAQSPFVPAREIANREDLIYYLREREKLSLHRAVCRIGSRLGVGRAVGRSTCSRLEAGQLFGSEFALEFGLKVDSFDKLSLLKTVATGDRPAASGS